MSDQRAIYAPGGAKIYGARLVLPGDRPDDFLRWAYDGAGENPLAWQASARNLLDAATAVKGQVHQFEEGLMDSLVPVQAMLLGLALECLLKGMYIKRHRVWEDPDKAHAIAKNGAYIGVTGAGDHELLQLADAAGVTLTNEERSALTRLTNFVLYAGRYPIPVRVEQMKPVKMDGGRTVARNYISAEELETGESLAARLMREIEPWS